MREKTTTDNPILTKFDTPFEIPPFDKIKVEHYLPAFELGMQEQKNNINKIVNNTDEPSFKNTIEAYELSGKTLNKISGIFYNVKLTDQTPEMLELSKILAPLLSSHNDDIKLNPALFKKINAVYEKRDKLNLSTEELTLTEKTYKNFVRGGANLKSDKMEAFRHINKELSSLYIAFSERLLAENNRFELVIDNEKDLDGLSEGSIIAASNKAKEKGYDNKWVFTIHKPSLLPFLENAKNRDLRKQMFEAYILKGDHNDSLDTKKIITEIANLRIKRAQLLGFNNHAEYILDNNMAKNPENVYELLNKLMEPALKVAKNEVADMQKMVYADGNTFKIEPWDYWYYAAKVKAKKYALNENEIRPYLKLENVADGVFWVAKQMYGITFTPITNAPTYNPKAVAYEVKESNGDYLGVLFMDYHPRESKRSGAWCTTFRGASYEKGKRIAPIVSIACNFTAPVGNTPALLTVDETKTLFHEFGHALDALFSNKVYASLGTPRDFVELPSQIMENWAFAPKVLNHYAKHYETGEPMPSQLITKIEDASKFNQGFATTEYLAASFLDMDWHTLTEPLSTDPNSFEIASMKKINLIKEIAPRYRSTYFQHIFSGNSYSAGYYSYVWAEVLDADAFNVFKENGLFDKETAKSFRENILEKGGTEDAMKLYVDFRGKQPEISALINRRGLY